MPTITAFKSSPDKGAGLARDMRVRWALEEVGQRYDVRLLTFAELKQAPHVALQPFGQIPSFEDGDIAVFETGAIVLHIAQHHPGLLPETPAERAKAISWMFAALSTIEPPILERESAKFLEADKTWQVEHFALIDARITTRLTQLAAALGDAPWLMGIFSAADILMVHTLSRLGSSGLLENHPSLVSYIARAKSRPAYQRAFSAQYEVFASLSN
ncbi:glutathione S-transferase family protein [Devosia sp. MC532]|uniref:glutathione S-transferase family protein n=1 Tax=Devosia sp. MC532 TaxID=2799788 RepID=UPI0018F79FE3|nr:glutathione S-transferase family protein [Devosia sp. MC532]MBJ7578713.1 glutathione S-transferase family protein [Devosia sp. MC532]